MFCAEFSSYRLLPTRKPLCRTLFPETLSQEPYPANLFVYALMRKGIGTLLQAGTDQLTSQISVSVDEEETDE